MSEFPMSEHAWAQEQIAAFVAGGLEAAEVERFEAHVRECFSCAEALDRARRLDRGMSSLFAQGLPGPDLESRTVLAFRAEPIRMATRNPWGKRALIAAGIGAVIALGGVVATHGNSLPMPGSGWEKRVEVALGFREGIERDIRVRLEANDQPKEDLTNEDPGFQSEVAAALKDGEGRIVKLQTTKGVDKEVVEAAVMLEDLGRKPDPKEISKYSIQDLGEADGRLVTDGSKLGVPDKQLNSFGYYPPERANVVRGTERYHADATVKLTKETSPGADHGVLLGDFYGRAGATKSQTLTAGGSNGTTLGRTLTWEEVAASGGEKDKKAILYDNYYGLKPKPMEWRFGEAPGASKPKDTPPANTSLADTTDPKPDNTKLRIALPPYQPVFQPPAPSSPQAPAPAEAAGKTIVIKSGEIEFEIDSFDSAAATVAKIVGGIKGAFVATVNSEKLQNGKMKGSITVRLPPEQLDGLLLDLRRELGKVGELKGSRIGAQDITKQYTDLESRLKAAKAMEQRLLEIIKNGGKGDIKGLVEAEQELGKWQTRIEEITGELRYYSNLVSLSTLTITLTEKNIKSAAGVIESERIQAGVEVEDVEKAQRQILDAVAEAKGRVTKSEMKQHSAGQFSALLEFEVAPDVAGPLRDRLRQIGRVARLEIDRVQAAEGAVSKTAKVERGDTIFRLQLYNLAAIPPREVSVVQLAVHDVQAAHQALREAVAKAQGRVFLDQTTKQDQQNDTAKFDFEIPRQHEGPVRAALLASGQVLTREDARAAESENVTDAKVMFRTTLLAASLLKPREKVTLSVEVPDVDQTMVVFGSQVKDAHGRQVDAKFSRDRAGQRSAKLVYEVPLTAAAGLVRDFKSAGVVRLDQSVQDAGAATGDFAIARLEVTVSSAEQIVGADEGLWPQVRRGLSYSAQVLLTSITWVVFGLCVVLPWAVIGYVAYRVVRGKLRDNRTGAGTTSTAAS